MPIAGSNVFPSHIKANAVCTGGLAEQAPASFVARLGPGIERASGERAPRIRHDQRLIVLQHRAEAVAARTRAARIVEGKERGRKYGRGTTARRAGGMLGEAPPIAVVERQGHAFAFAEGGSDSVGE